MTKKIIWLASYPKSGNTWVRSLITNILYSNDYIFNFNLLRNIIEFDIPANYKFLLNKNQNDFDNLNNIEIISKYWIKAQKNYNLNQQKKIFKTHSANISFLGNNYTQKETTKGVIYIIRDPRDIVVSYSKHLNKSSDDIIYLLQKNNTTTYSAKGNYPILLSRWDYHIKSWYKLDVPKIFIQYEHLLKNTKGVILQLIHFLNNNLEYNININDKDLNKIIKYTNFDSLKNEETKKGFPEATKNSPFFRSGEHNQWEKKLTIKQQKKIQEIFKDTMRKFNYN